MIFKLFDKFNCCRSGRIYAIDTQKDPRAPSLYKVVQPDDVIQKTGLAFPHTAHCLASGEILVSYLGDKDGNAEGSGFLLLDSDFNVKGRYCIVCTVLLAELPLSVLFIHSPWSLADGYL